VSQTGSAIAAIPPSQSSEFVSATATGSFGDHEGATASLNAFIRPPSGAHTLTASMTFAIGEAASASAGSFGSAATQAIGFLRILDGAGTSIASATLALPSLLSGVFAPSVTTGSPFPFVVPTGATLSVPTPITGGTSLIISGGITVTADAMFTGVASVLGLATSHVITVSGS